MILSNRRFKWGSMSLIPCFFFRFYFRSIIVSKFHDVVIFFYFDGRHLSWLWYFWFEIHIYTLVSLTDVFDWIDLLVNISQTNTRSLLSWTVCLDHLLQSLFNRIRSFYFFSFRLEIQQNLIGNWTIFCFGALKKVPLFVSGIIELWSLLWYLAVKFNPLLVDSFRWIFCFKNYWCPNFYWTFLRKDLSRICNHIHHFHFLSWSSHYLSTDTTAYFKIL